jgi:hypothetical protein
MTTTPGPGLRQQAGVRTFFRVAGALLVTLGVVVFLWGLLNVFGDRGFDPPAGVHIAAFIGGLPLIGFGLMCLQAGLLGAAARYGAGETMPVVKDSATYLSDGEGVLGVGRTVDDPGAGAAVTGPYCRSCGRRNDEDARFCDGCGTSLS